jgi:hypothetical protein
MKLELVILSKPILFRYNNSDHMSFHKISCEICKKYILEIGDESLVTDYEEKVEQEESVFKWVRKSDYTVKKSEADGARDETSLGIIQVVRGNLHHFDPTVRDAAVHVNNLLENYGDFRYVNYDAETASIDSIVTRLKSAGYSVAVNLLGLSPWVEKLEADNALFKTFVADTTVENLERPVITTIVARRETDTGIRMITNRVTALITLNGPDAYVAFANEFNEVVKHYNTLVHEHYGRIHARIDIASAIIATIAPQPKTGKPVLVIPTVSLRTVKADVQENVELVFSVDFTVAFKNNVKPGTATIIISGIGKYKGEIVTTFNII